MTKIALVLMIVLPNGQLRGTTPMEQPSFEACWAEAAKAVAPDKIPDGAAAVGAACFSIVAGPKA
jgi:hypothetical protein